MFATRAEQKSLVSAAQVVSSRFNATEEGIWNDLLSFKQLLRIFLLSHMTSVIYTQTGLINVS